MLPIFGKPMRGKRSTYPSTALNYYTSNQSQEYSSPLEE